MSSFIGFIIGVAIIIAVCNWDAAYSAAADVLRAYPLAVGAFFGVALVALARRAS